jgi:signal transduction histidine kinase/DNA-binding response OmpR family regulator/ligand-binding sensor domain-containing protein
LKLVTVWLIKKTLGSLMIFLVTIFYPAGLSGSESFTPASGGFKRITNYSSEVYNLLPQNWCILQDRRGIVYAANQGGVLEYDGVSWRTIKVPNNMVRSMSMTEDGTIFIGGVNEMGYLEADANGKLKYTSLIDRLGEEERQFSSVYQLQCAESGAWFRTAKKIFLWQNNRFKIMEKIKSGGGFKAVFTWNGSLYIQEKDVGLLQVAGDSFKEVPGSEPFADEKIYVATPYDDKRLLIGTRLKNLFLFDGAAAVRFPTEVDDYLKKNRLSHGTALSNGEFALATLGGGVVIIDSTGRLTGLYTNEMGLGDDNVKYVFEDSGGNLWLGLNQGISHIGISSPISFFDGRANLKGLTLSLVRYNGYLFVGTSGGLFYLEPPLPGRLPRFRPVPGTSGDFWDLLDLGDTMLAATHQGVLQVDMTVHTAGTSSPAVRFKVRPAVLEGPVIALTQSKHFPNRVWAGSVDRLVVLNKTGSQWGPEHRYDEVRQLTVRAMAEDKNGNLWLGTQSKGVIKFSFPSGIHTARVRQFGAGHGLPSGTVRVVEAADHLVFATPKGIYRFDNTKETFVPDMLLGEMFAGGSKDVFRLAADQRSHIWFHSNRRNYCALLQPGGGYRVDDTPFKSLPAAQANAIYPEERMVWFADSNGLFRYDMTVKKNYQQPFHALIRTVTTRDGTVIYGGVKKESGEPTELPELEYKQRHLRFDIAAPFFEESSKTLYQYLMEGYDDDWSEWTSAASGNYPRMSPGRYTLKVRAKNVFGIISDEDSFTFYVLSPWYLTWWSFALYAAVVVLLVSQIVRWRSAKLVREKLRLEGIIEKRTREIHQANTQLQQKTFQLEEQSEKLKEMDKIKSRFFANISHEFRTPLTLIMGPLDNIRFGLKSKDPGTVKEIDRIYRNAQRLLVLINQLLDLSRFDSGKMKLQAEPRELVSFLNSIIGSFESAVEQNRQEMVFNPAADNMPLFFDPEKLEKVISNLLSNAIKFTPRGGRITLSAVYSDAKGETVERAPDSGGYVKVSVRDTGPGIPAEQLTRVFDRFYQAEVTEEHHRKGTGIGLALVKELVGLHHGKVDVHSTVGENSGTEFIVRLPLGHAHLTGSEIVDSRTPREEGEPLFAAPPEAVTAEELEPVTPPLQPPASPGKEIILVVEDNSELRDYIRSTLEPGYTVVEAVDGKEGVEKAAEMIPDLIVSDVMMPRMNGYELCKTIKSDLSTSHIPVILLTARASEDSLVQGLQTGADDYITKPFSTRALRVRIRNLIDLRRQLQLKLNREMVLQPSRIEISEMDREFLKELQEVIEQNMSEPDFNVEDLSKRLYMSRTTVYRKVQALSGETPTDFIRSYRLMRAAQLLKARFGSVTEVAFEVGFSSRAYFTKCFKEKFQQLPSEFVTSESS